MCSNILYCERGVSFLLSPSRIHVQGAPMNSDVAIVGSRWRHNCCHWLWVKERHIDKATMWYETYVMTYVATQSSLDDFPLWIPLDLDPDRVSSDSVRVQAKSWVKSQVKTVSEYGPWCPGAKAPGHQYPQCWLDIHCIGPVSYKNIAYRWTASENEITFWKKWPSHLRVNSL